LLEGSKGRIEAASLRHALRDHYGRGLPPIDRTPADPQYFSVCMHAEPVGTTTASMVASLPADPDVPLLYWASLGSPCVGAFMPLFVDADVPAALGRGGEQPSSDSPWWQFKQLLTCVERDWQGHLPHVRQSFDQFEGQIEARMREESILSAPAAQRAAFVATTVTQLMGLLQRMIADVR
jgi:secernin